MKSVDPRFEVPLYTVAEAARHVGVAPSTVRYWVFEKEIIHYLAPERKGDACLPFVAIAEIKFIKDLRRAHLSLRAVVEGVQALRREIGPEYLKRERLAHDGQDILVRLADSDAEWTRARDEQAGIPGVIAMGLQGIDFDGAGTPQRVTLQSLDGAEIIVDPRFSFGQPVIESRGVRVEDIAQLFFAGETISVVAREFGVPQKVVEAIVRNYGRPRAA